jgi:replicative superfamily II helicase
MMSTLTQIRGVKHKVAAKLEAAGYAAVKDLSSISAVDLSQKTGIPAKTAENIILAAADLVEDSTDDQPLSEDSQQLAGQVAEVIATDFGAQVKAYRKLAKKIFPKKKYKKYRKVEDAYLKAIQRLDIT